ncbi:MAG: hypothetical protein HOV68_09725, partial [Streptomycetaceae bacterium]|nr:hypothetical protein [Streptomycetaceae bacterium]
MGAGGVDASPLGDAHDRARDSARDDAQDSNRDDTPSAPNPPEPRPRTRRHPARRALLGRWAVVAVVVAACVLASLGLFGSFRSGDGGGPARTLIDTIGHGGSSADGGAAADGAGAPARPTDLSRDELGQLVARQTDALRRRDQAAFLEPYAADRPDLVAERTRL